MDDHTVGFIRHDMYLELWEGNYLTKTAQVNLTWDALVRAATGKLPGCTDRCASLRGDRLPTPHNPEMVQQGLAENHLADTQVHDS